MRIRKMTATFGNLQGATLEFHSGLNVITAPNESGKSTWCAFLQAMFYGISTRERDSKTALADKNRYQPWSGSPMQGELDLVWQGQEITLRRYQKGATPFGGFEAVYTGTGEPIPSLTATSCGEILLGVSKETFQRSAFVRQSGMTIDSEPELERRIAALATTGGEEVSFSETQRLLKGWLNRRKHNKTGLIPKLEEESTQLAQLIGDLRYWTGQLAQGESSLALLEEQQQLLQEELGAQRARQDWARHAQYREAEQELDKAREELRQLDNQDSQPEKEALRNAQGDLSYLKTLDIQIREAQNQIEPHQQKVVEAEEGAKDELFGTITPEQAVQRAQLDRAKAESVVKESVYYIQMALLGLGAIGAGLGGWFAQMPVLFGVAGALAAGIGLVVWNLSKAKKAKAQNRAQIFEHYGVDSVEGMLPRAQAYGEAYQRLVEAKELAQAVEDSLERLTQQRQELWDSLLDFAHGFAPTVTDMFGVSAALSRALSLEERLATAKVKVAGAQRLVESLPALNTEVTYEEGTAPPVPKRSAQETKAALSAVKSELSRFQQEVASCQGRIEAMGNLVELEERQERLQETLDRRQQEYTALSLAIEHLEQANAALQVRLSPAINQRAGEIFSALTGGRYEGVVLNRELEASAYLPGDLQPHRGLTLSKGTGDQLYLAVRLAVCDLALPREEAAPVVLDDALADFDDQRMGLALDFLQGYSQERQVILFSCHSREEGYLKD